MKKTLGSVNALYPTPTTIVGAHVSGHPNFVTIAHIGIFNYGKNFDRPEVISIGLAKRHHTNQGIHENRTFSVNIPSENMVELTDYCGLVSGKNTDKSALFEIFYGETPAAPMIASCPVCMECRLKDVYDTGTHDVFIGEVVQTHADEAVLTNEAIDLTKVRPLLFDMASRKYFSLGPAVADCWSVGKQLKRRD